MFNSDTLSQLSALKKDIRVSKNLSEGTVRGTAGRYGFVGLDDGRDVYLNADIMEQVFPGDRVEVSVTENDRKQLEGKLEKLIKSPLKKLAGKYRIKGKGHFVVYTDNQYNRWIFVPPKERAKSQDGDYVIAKIIQHPFSNNKPQAKIVNNLGKESTAANIRQFAIAQHQLHEGWTKEVIEETKQLQHSAFDAHAGDHREDLREMTFVTIDSASTNDMDDALSISVSDEGWDLWVAIADPSCEINEKSAISRMTLQRAQTLYFPGKPLSMLPEELSTKRYSLIAGEDRLAMACRFAIDTSGKITAYKFSPAIIQSKAKLSYQQASQLLLGETCDNLITTDTPENLELITLLQALKNCTDSLHKNRKTQQLVLENRPDFSLKLNKRGKLESIEKNERSLAHQIVEEAMVATNQCAGEFLAEHKQGIFSTHKGFKEERREDIEKLIAETLGDEVAINTQTLESYLNLMRLLQSDEKYSLLMSKQQRFQDGSQLSLEPSPHYGLGAQFYAMVTSPIRRFQDLYNQRLLHHIINKKPIQSLKPTLLEKAKEVLSNNRSATRLAQFWLIADYMEDKIGDIFIGKIALLTNQGIGVRLKDSGIEGFIPAIKEDKKAPEKPHDKVSFNNQRLELTWNDKSLELDQEVEVRLNSIDSATRKLTFEWVSNKN